MSTAISDRLDLVQSRDDLALFVDALREDFATNAEAWENGTLPAYLDAMSAVIRETAVSSDDIATGWQVMARILMYASRYE